MLLWITDSTKGEEKEEEKKSCHNNFPPKGESLSGFPRKKKWKKRPSRIDDSSNRSMTIIILHGPRLYSGESWRGRIARCRRYSLRHDEATTPMGSAAAALQLWATPRTYSAVWWTINICTHQTLPPITAVARKASYSFLFFPLILINILSFSSYSFTTGNTVQINNVRTGNEQNIETGIYIRMKSLPKNHRCLYNMKYNIGLLLVVVDFLLRFVMPLIFRLMIHVIFLNVEAKLIRNTVDFFFYFWWLVIIAKNVVCNARGLFRKSY